MLDIQRKINMSFKGISSLGLAALLIHTAKAGGHGCPFTITSSGGFPVPAGQLSDGQIRFNASLPAARFTLVGDTIIDSAGRGCIVTEPPTTQVQCDSGKPPAPGFSIGAGNVISWKGNTKFSVCPATDTEYNVYVNPEFGQTKCFPVTLTASSGCGGTTTCPAPPTVTETCTITSILTSTITIPLTVTESCSSVSSMSAPPVTACNTSKNCTWTTSSTKSSSSTGKWY